ncbi:MAG: hypothetical protein AAFV88_25970, partial [Planctomycetota bacterium]
MNKPIGILLATVFAVLVLIIASLTGPAFFRDRTGRALIGQPVVGTVSTFLAPEDLVGSSFILLSDMNDDECNARQN